MKKRVKLSLIWILVFILTCVNSNIIFAFSGMTAEEYYKNSTIIPEILENNIKMDLCQYFGHKKLNIFSLHDINT